MKNDITNNHNYLFYPCKAVKKLIQLKFLRESKSIYVVILIYSYEWDNILRDEFLICVCVVIFHNYSSYYVFNILIYLLCIALVQIVKL